MNTSKKPLIIAGVIVLVVAIVLIWCGIARKDAPSSGKLVTGLPEQTFSGTITAVDTGCFVDATCSVSVDGRKIILEQGRMLATTTPVIGRLIGVDSIGDLEQHIGDHANVYAATTTTAGQWTLYGNEQYYVEVVKIK